MVGTVHYPLKSTGYVTWCCLQAVRVTGKEGRQGKVQHLRGCGELDACIEHVNIYA